VNSVVRNIFRDDVTRKRIQAQAQSSRQSAQASCCGPVCLPFHLKQWRLDDLDIQYFPPEMLFDLVKVLGSAVQSIKPPTYLKEGEVDWLYAYEKIGICNEEGESVEVQKLTRRNLFWWSQVSLQSTYKSLFCSQRRLGSPSNLPCRFGRPGERCGLLSFYHEDMQSLRTANILGRQI
jgi:hypothetical protein